MNRCVWPCVCVSRGKLFSLWVLLVVDGGAFYGKRKGIFLRILATRGGIFTRTI